MELFGRALLGRPTASLATALALGFVLGACSAEPLGPHVGVGSGGSFNHPNGSGGSSGGGGELGTPTTGGRGGGIGWDGGIGGDGGTDGTGAISGTGGEMVGVGSTACAAGDLTACGVGEYCQVLACGDTTGVCRTRPDLATCTGPAELVCGCDNGLYDIPCAAAARGTSIRNLGTCPPLPSGPCTSQADCGGADYANLVACVPSTCDSPAGTCTPIGTGCNILLVGTDAYDVCGCDGKTYGDPCAARAAGVTVASQGPCPDAGAPQ